MRHFLARPIPQLPQRMAPPSPTRPLVNTTGIALASSSCSSCTRLPAVPSTRHVAHRAQRHRAPARRVPADDDGERDHGVDANRLDIRVNVCDPRTSRFATSRSRGAIEGRGGISSVSLAYVRHTNGNTQTMTFTAIAVPWAPRRPVLFTATGGDVLRRVQQRSTKSWPLCSLGLGGVGCA